MQHMFARNYWEELTPKICKQIMNHRSVSENFIPRPPGKTVIIAKHRLYLKGIWAGISSSSPHHLLIISSLSPHKYMRGYRTMSREGGNKDGGKTVAK